MPNTLDLTADAVQFQCRHIRPDGRRCGSPALRARNFCYHHDLTRRPGPRQPDVNTARAAKLNTFSLPTPADLAERAGLQIAVAQILHKIANNEIDPRRAGLLLYGLQIAAGILPKTDAPPRPTQLVEEVIQDPDFGALATEAEWSEPEPEENPSVINTLNSWLVAVRSDDSEAPARQTTTRHEVDRPAPQPASPGPSQPATHTPITLTASTCAPNRAQRRALRHHLRRALTRRPSPDLRSTPAPRDTRNRRPLL